MIHYINDFAHKVKIFYINQLVITSLDCYNVHSARIKLAKR